ncbi:MAG: Uma2 family endonuclease [Planctomycetia bacterium]|nr:Uma2 family endonuclease [Planctomycetia bacterium]
MPETMAVQTPVPAPVGVADDVLYEVIDGLVVEKPPMGAYQGVVAAWLIRLLITSDAASRLGLVVSEILFHLDPSRDRKRRPDVAFVSYERWPGGRPVPMGEAWEIVPDLAVEIISKSNTADEVVDKLEEYFQAGVRLVWVVYTVRRILYVYTSPTDVRILKPGDDLDGGPVLPGFRVPVKAVFGDEG